MAASSPVKSNNSTDFGLTPPTANPSKSLRGLNKPKCIKCGNVARSRCPYQSCKNCCSKAQNPCHIHVLKGNSSIPEKVPSSASSTVEQQVTDASHSGNSNRLRQLSCNFAQFNNLQTPLRSRKPVTRKDAEVINEWRFSKLKDFIAGNIEAANEAFGRYMQNVHLLEEVFSVDSTDEVNQSEQCFGENENCSEETDEVDVHGWKLKLRSDPSRRENLRNRTLYIIEQGLRKLRNFELEDSCDPDELGKMPKKIKSQQAEHASAISDLIDKLNKARNKEDLTACREVASQILKTRQMGSDDDHNMYKNQNPENDPLPEEHTVFSPPKWVESATLDQEQLSRIDAHFSSLEEIEDL